MGYKLQVTGFWEARFYPCNLKLATCNMFLVC